MSQYMLLLYATEAEGDELAEREAEIPAIWSELNRSLLADSAADDSGGSDQSASRDRPNQPDLPSCRDGHLGGQGRGPALRGEQGS